MEGQGAESFLMVLLTNSDVLVGPLVGLVYPLYASIQAIESGAPADHQQWLTYWVLYSMITLFELTFVPIVQWIPFWSYAKLILTCWLALPYFSGAAYVYGDFVRPFYHNSIIVKNVQPNDGISNATVISRADRYENSGSSRHHNSYGS